MALSATAELDAVVIGAGQAGLATGYALRRAGLDFVILEQQPEPGGSWPHYYDSLTLFSPARFSSLPGLAIQGDQDRYPTRDDVVAYLREYARHFDLPVRCSTPVISVARAADNFIVEVGGGRPLTTRTVVAASGAFGRPREPRLEGADRFRGKISHSSRYANPFPYAGQRILVVGRRNSAVQIAAELASVARVTLVGRQPIRFRQQRPLGRDVHFWWWLTRTDRSPRLLRFGYRSGILASGAVLDEGAYRRALEDGRYDWRPMFREMTETGVVWADGEHETIDTVILATGYTPALDYLTGLVALDRSGLPRHRHGVSLDVPGLYFVGLEDQRTYASATLRGVGPDAEYVVRRIGRLVASPPPAR